MKVKGTLEELQSSLDFYILLCSVGENKTVDSLRRHYFDEFLENEVKLLGEQCNSAPLSMEIKKIEPEEEDKVEEVFGIEVGSSKEEDEYLEELLSTLESEESVESEEPKVEEDFSSGYLIHDEIVSEIEPVDLSNAEIVHGVFIEDIEVVSQEDEEVEGYSEDAEEYYEEQEERQEEYDEGELSDVDKGYSDHGTYIEDIQVIDSGYEEVNKDIEENNYDEYENEEWDDEYEDEESEEIEEEENVDSYEGQDLGTENEDGDWEEYEDYEEVQQTEEPVVLEEIEEPPIIEKKNTEIETERVDVPADLREFLRKYPCSEISFVQKYYSKREIETQIKLGRVYKFKGKLMI